MRCFVRVVILAAGWKQRKGQEVTAEEPLNVLPRGQGQSSTEEPKRTQSCLSISELWWILQYNVTVIFLKYECKLLGKI